MRKPLDFTFGSVALTTGETGVLAYVSFPCNVEGAQVAAFSVESNPTFTFTVQRFVVGLGVTTWNISAAITPSSFGTSGVLGQGLSLLPAGSTLLQLMANDVIGYQIGGGATAGIFGLVGTVLVRPMQDVRQYFGFI